MSTGFTLRLCISGIFVFLCVFSARADKTWEQNQKANKLYKEGKFDKALKLYDQALLAAPEDKKLAVNKGLALNRLGQFQEASEAFESAQSLKEPKARAALLYNAGTNLAALAQGGGDQSQMQQAKALLEKSRDSYIQALDVDALDEDSKWNLEIVQAIIKQLKDQDKQDNNQDKQDKNNQDKQDQKQDQKQEQDKNQDKKDQDKQQQDQQEKQDQNKEQDKKEQDKKDEQQQKPGEQNKPEEQKEQPAPKPDDQKKQEALRLLMQYADDAKELNKPPEKEAQAVGAKKPEKDW